MHKAQTQILTNFDPPLNTLIIIHFRQQWTLDKAFAYERLLAKRRAVSIVFRHLNFAHLSALSRRRKERRMYNPLQHEYYWPDMSTDVYDTVRYCKN